MGVGLSRFNVVIGYVYFGGRMNGWGLVIGFCKEEWYSKCMFNF